MLETNLSTAHKGKHGQGDRRAQRSLAAHGGGRAHMQELHRWPQLLKRWAHLKARSRLGGGETCWGQGWPSLGVCWPLGRTPWNAAWTGSCRGWGEGRGGQRRAKAALQLTRTHREPGSPGEVSLWLVGEGGVYREPLNVQDLPSERRGAFTGINKKSCSGSVVQAEPWPPEEETKAGVLTRAGRWCHPEKEGSSECRRQHSDAGSKSIFNIQSRSRNGGFPVTLANSSWGHRLLRPSARVVLCCFNFPRFEA